MKIKNILSKLILVSSFATNIFANSISFNVNQDHINFYVNQDLRNEVAESIRFAIDNSDLDTLDALLSDLSSKKDKFIFGTTNERPTAFYNEMTIALNEKNAPLIKIFLKYENQNQNPDGFLFVTLPRNSRVKGLSDVLYFLWKNGAKDKPGCSQYTMCHMDEYYLLEVALRDKNFKMVNELFETSRYNSFEKAFFWSKYNRHDAIEILNMLAEHRSKISGFEDFLKAESLEKFNLVAHKIFFPEEYKTEEKGTQDLIWEYMDYMMGLPKYLVSKFR